tara:strand:+ start:72 stop:281 length:210 start_codon:yes stop_codon:yes gene_type:complete
MGDYMTSKDLDRGEARTGVARQQEEARKREIELAERLEREERELEKAILADWKRQQKAKSKKSSGKSKK